MSASTIDPDAFFVPITEHAAEPLLDAAGIRAGMRILDIATGSGVIAAHGAARGAIATGVDISSRMISLARKLNPACVFREADAESLPFADGSFDAVLCAFGIGHFPRADVAIAECARVLVPGGWLAFAWWDAPVRNRLQGVLLEAVAEAGANPPPDLPAGPPMFRYSDDGAFGALLASTGGESGIRLWNVLTGQPLETLKGHSDLAQAVSFGADGTRLVSEGEARPAVLHGDRDHAFTLADVQREGAEPFAGYVRHS